MQESKVTTEEELVLLLNELNTLKRKERASHEIVIGFEAQSSSQQEIESFVSEVQAELQNSNLGFLQICGIDEDGMNGEFLINCREHTDLQKTYEQIRPILNNYTFLEQSHMSIDESIVGGEWYHFKIETVRGDLDFSYDDDDIELPIPEGFENNEKGKGCMGLIALVFAVITVLVFV